MIDEPPDRLANSATTPPAVEDDAPAIDTTRLGTTLLLLAELMLFSGLIAAYLVLRNGHAALFSDFGNDFVNRLIGALAVSSLLFAVALMAIATRALRLGSGRSVAAELTIALLVGTAVLGLTAMQWHRLLNRATVIAIDPAGSRTQFVYDGRRTPLDGQMMRIEGSRAPARGLAELDPHAISGRQLQDAAVTADALTTTAPASTQPHAGAFDVPLAGATVVTYGPWKNVYYSCFYLLTGTLALHVLAAMLWTLVTLRKAIARTLAPARFAALSTYWQFVTLATLVVSRLLYWN